MRIGADVTAQVADEAQAACDATFSRVDRGAAAGGGHLGALVRTRVEESGV